MESHQGQLHSSSGSQWLTMADYSFKMQTQEEAGYPKKTGLQGSSRAVATYRWKLYARSGRSHGFSDVPWVRKTSLRGEAT